MAVLASRHQVPFYVAAPTSSIDLDCASGEFIPIEERAAREVTHILRQQIAPTGIRVANPAFDVTPHELVSAIVTERGIARDPFDQTLSPLVRKGETGKRGNGERAKKEREKGERGNNKKVHQPQTEPFRPQAEIPSPGEAEKPRRSKVK
jgi:hypothetical protein